MNYANQSQFKIMPLGELEHTRDTTDQFLTSLNWQPLLNVMSDLTDPEFKLWFYILKWRGGNAIYQFSPADLEINFGWSENSARNYKKQLEIKGYLVKQSKNIYEFNPYPTIAEKNAALKREKNRSNREARGMNVPKNGTLE